MKSEKSKTEITADGVERLKIALHANGLEKSGNLQEMLDRLLSAGKPPGPVRKTIVKKKGKGDVSIVKVIETSIRSKLVARLALPSSSSEYDAALLTLARGIQGVDPPRNWTTKHLAVLLADELLK